LEAVAPYTIIKTRDKLFPEGVETDIIQIDATPIIFLLVNAANDLKGQLEALERKP
jgi:hypothetical protein